MVSILDVLRPFMGLNANRLDVACPFCKAPAGKPCIVIQTGRPRESHAVRKYGRP